MEMSACFQKITIKSRTPTLLWLLQNREIHTPSFAQWRWISPGESQTMWKLLHRVMGRRLTKVGRPLITSPHLDMKCKVLVRVFRVIEHLQSQHPEVRCKGQRFHPNKVGFGDIRGHLSLLFMLRHLLTKPCLQCMQWLLDWVPTSWDPVAHFVVRMDHPCLWLCFPRNKSGMDVELELASLSWMI